MNSIIVRKAIVVNAIRETGKRKIKVEIQTVRNSIQKHKQNKILTISEVEHYQYNTGTFDLKTQNLLLESCFHNDSICSQTGVEKSKSYLCIKKEFFKYSQILERLGGCEIPVWKI